MRRGGSRAAATSKTERFVIIVNDFQPSIIVTKHSMLDVAAAPDPPLLSILCNDPDAKLQTVVGNNNKICEVFEVFSFKFVKKFFDCIVNVSYSSVYLKKDKSYVQKVIPVNATSNYVIFLLYIKTPYITLNHTMPITICLPVHCKSLVNLLTMAIKQIHLPVEKKCGECSF